MTSGLRLFWLLLTCLTLSACYEHERHEWRQKLTVVVDTPDGQVSSSAVVQINATYYGQLPATGTEVDYEISGEATVVEVAPGKYLFAAIDVAPGRIPTAFKDDLAGMTRQEWLREIPNLERAVSLPRSQIPILMATDDINRAASLVVLEPEELSDFFGSGISLNSVVVKVTDEPVTHGIASTLVEQMLGASPGQLFGDDKYDVPVEIAASNRELMFGAFGHDLGVGQFVTRDRWRIR